VLTSYGADRNMRSLHFGAIAQLGERLHGMQEVGGSIPPSSTKVLKNRFIAVFFCLYFSLKDRQ
jgi:hypothetical protein